MKNADARPLAAIALGLSVFISAPVHAVVLNFTEYTIDFTPTSDVDGLSSSGSFGGNYLFFRWNGAASAGSLFGGSAQETIALPSFTLTAASGYHISDLAFFSGGYYSLQTFSGAANTASASVDFSTGAWSAGTGTFSASDGKTVVGAQWNIDTPQPGFSPAPSVSLASGSLTLNAATTGFAASTVHVSAENPGFYFQVTPVPEASEWAMMLSGLGIVGLIARRRRAAAAGGRSLGMRTA